MFDDKGKTIRDEWYPQYKATRSAMPDALAQQVEPINEVVKLLGWPVLCVPGIEADDAIGTIAKAAARPATRSSSPPATRTSRNWSTKASR